MNDVLYKLSEFTQIALLRNMDTIFHILMIF
jgi:hypothetical protein